MDNQFWNYLITAVGLFGFYLAGKKVWWCWYVNIINQVLWFTYGWVTDQWGFVLGTFFYTFVFVKNAISWTKEHNRTKRNIAPNPLKNIIPHDPSPTVSFRFDASGFQEGMLLTQQAMDGLVDRFEHGPKRWRWLPLWIRKRIFKKPPAKWGQSGPQIGEVTSMEEDGNGIRATMTIDRSTVAGQAAWDAISSPGPFSISEQRRRDALANYGFDSATCISTTTWQGREVACETDDHPHGMHHQAILADMMPPLQVFWDDHGGTTAEELND